MVVNEDFITANFPLHDQVWKNNAVELDRLLYQDEFRERVEQIDPRGRTPLLLAVTLGHGDCVLILLNHNADAQFEDSSGWNVSQEAVCQGNPEILKLILEHREIQKRCRRANLIPNLLRRLKDAPDFFAEMRWEFTSWIPLLTRMCPTNRHRVYKSGSNVRVDSTMTTFDEPQWQKGDVSLIFQGTDDGVRMVEVDHGSKQVFVSVVLSGGATGGSAGNFEKAISQKLSNPSITSFVNLEKIAFERSKSGLWGWGADKREKVGGFDCKVFTASNVELVTRIRVEHLTEDEKGQRNNEVSNLHRLLSTFASPASTETRPSDDDASVEACEYFDEKFDLQGRDAGRPKEMQTKVNKFKATLWLCEKYPLNLQEQVMPILDIMAISSSQFSKLKEFITMQVPAGFPIRIESPMFHLVNACVSFHNVQGVESPVIGVECVEEENGRISCVLEENLFEPPPHYEMKNTSGMGLSNSDEDLFGWAGGETGLSDKIDIYEALNVPRPQMTSYSPDPEEQLLQRAIEESLMMARGYSRTESVDDLQAALDASRRENEAAQQLVRDEDEALQRVIQLSLTEK